MSWKNKSIFKGASFHLNKSEIVSILGVSGVRKTTLFKKEDRAFIEEIASILNEI